MKYGNKDSSASAGCGCASGRAEASTPHTARDVPLEIGSLTHGAHGRTSEPKMYCGACVDVLEMVYEVIPKASSGVYAAGEGECLPCQTRACELERKTGASRHLSAHE